MNKTGPHKLFAIVRKIYYYINDYILISYHYDLMRLADGIPKIKLVFYEILHNLNAIECDASESAEIYSRTT